MARQYLIPGGSFINESSARQFQIPGEGFVNDTSSTVGAALAGNAAAVATAIAILAGPPAALSGTAAAVATATGSMGAAGAALAGAAAAVSAASAVLIGTLATSPLRNNTGTLLANEAGVVLNIYNTATGVLVVQKTGITTNVLGVAIVSDALIVNGTTYAYEPVLTGNRRRLPTKVAT